MFAGGKKKKKYSWMTGGGGVGSGASTPRPSAGGAPSTPGATTATGPAARASRGPLTQPGPHVMGAFREDSEKGKNIQLRDWIYALEDKGHDLRSLQQAYAALDRSQFGDKVPEKV
jgi:hypothetical protein